MGGASRFVILLTSPPFRPTLLLHLPLRLLSTSPTLRHFNTSNLPLISPVKSFSSPIHTQQSNNNTTSISHPHPWPEWSRLVNSLKPSSNEVEEEQGFYVSAEQEIVNEDAFVVYEEKALSPEFVSYASDLLAFARRNPQLLGMLSRRNIEVVVTNGTPFLFRAALETARRMRTFLAVDGGNAMGADNASTVDLMKYILSYASNPAIPSSRTNIYSRELVESSIRNLMQELAVLNSGTPSSNHPAEEQIQFQDRYGQTSGPRNQNIVMKRGDWICSKCSFMNFARNNKCLECEEHKPRKTLTGGEWECPQCDFFNYGRNMVCLRCDCKRPGPTPTNLVNSTSASGPNGDYAYHSSTDHRPSRDVNASDTGSTTNEDFPEIMPLRRGENRFVVSTRKTPLERRQANTSEGIASGPVGAGKSNIDELVKRSLDNILGRTSDNSQNEDKGITSGDNKNKEEEDKSGRWFKRMAELHGAKDLSSAVSDEDFPEIMPVRKGENRFVVSKNKNRSLTSPTEQASSSKYVPYVPFPPGYFARTEPQPPEESASPAQNIANSTDVPGDSLHPSSNNDVQSGWKGKSLEGSAVKETDPLDMSEEAKAERWFKRVAQIKDISELSQIPDEDFPSIMPMRKGVNRFVVSKRKTPMERRLTSSQYRRNLPVETNDPWRKDDNPRETK